MCGRHTHASKIPALTLRNITFFFSSEAEFAVIEGINVKGSRENLFMLLFLSLIILNNSFGDIVTEVFELIVRECRLLSGLLLASISETK